MPSAAVLSLVIGALLNLCGSGRWSLPVAAWLTPVFLLHFSRSQAPATGLAWLYLALCGTIYWAYRGLIPAPGWLPAAISALIALASLLPFAVDRFVAARIPGFAAILVFPLAWGSPAYTQYGNLPLMQLASVTGTVGITFMVTWFASVVNWMWASPFDWSKVHTGALIYATALCLVLGLGAARLVFTPAPEKTVRIAAIGWPEGILERSEMWRAFDPKLSSDERHTMTVSFERIHQYFFDATQREARAGAKIIVWPEANNPVFHEDEPALLRSAGELARQEQVRVLMGLAVIYAGAARPLENKVVLIDPSGMPALGYVKGIPVPGMEAQLSRLGVPRIATIDTPFGRIATAICFDLDFPWYLRQVGAARADLLLVPASDWRAINRLHYVFAIFRAIENGVPMVRATRWGHSVAVDALGNEVAKLDPFVSPNQTMVAQVPLGHVATIYARFGDWFGWLCSAALLGLCGWALALARRRIKR